MPIRVIITKKITLIRAIVIKIIIGILIITTVGGSGIC